MSAQGSSNGGFWSSASRLGNKALSFAADHAADEGRGSSLMGNFVGGLAVATSKPNWKRATWFFAAFTLIMIGGAVIASVAKNNTALAWTASLAGISGFVTICAAIYTATLIDQFGGFTNSQIFNGGKIFGSLI